MLLPRDLSDFLAKYIVFSVVGKFGDDTRVFMDRNTIFAIVVIEDGKRNLPTFVYPAEKDHKNPKNVLNIDLYNANSRENSFHQARGKLARFWNKWASKPYLRHLRKSYGSAYEQLIMLTWLELALVRQVDEHGKGKVELLRLTKKIDQQFQWKNKREKSFSLDVHRLRLKIHLEW